MIITMTVSPVREETRPLTAHEIDCVAGGGMAKLGSALEHVEKEAKELLSVLKILEVNPGGPLKRP